MAIRAALRGLSLRQVMAGLSDMSSARSGSVLLRSALLPARTLSELVENKIDLPVKVTSDYKSSVRHDAAIMFTCKKCETRSTKTFCRETYETGIIIVRCGGCQNLHLICDRLGKFGEPGSVEDFLEKNQVRIASDNAFQLTLEDLTGWSPPEKANSSSTAAPPVVNTAASSPAVINTTNVDASATAATVDEGDGK